MMSHASVLFIVLLGLSLTGFFVDLKENTEQHSFFLRAKIVFGIEIAYVIMQYLVNVFKIEFVTGELHKEEFLIIFGIGSEQQLGFYEDEVNMFDSLYPFNVGIIMLLIISVFTRYVGKPSLQTKRFNFENDENAPRRNDGRQTENSSEHTGRRDDDMLTVIDDG